MNSSHIAASAKGKPVVALCGGVGGAKLALGLQKVLGTDLTVIVNTGDDFSHLGLRICPDIDTVVYTLSGLSDLERGWGRAGESWNFMHALREAGGEDWFQLGDRDLAMHIQRTHALRNKTALSEFTSAIAKRLGISARIVPMTDDIVETTVLTPEGLLSFQKYFVGQQCRPVVNKIEFLNAAGARPSEAAIASLAHPDLEAVIICPSNPYLSVDPILAVPGYREALAQTAAPIVAVSPLVGHKAVKGPTTKIMDELGIKISSASIARHYPFISGLVIDESDLADAKEVPVLVHIVPTLMKTLDDRERLASECLRFAEVIRSHRRVS